MVLKLVKVVVLLLGTFGFCSHKPLPLVKGPLRKFQFKDEKEKKAAILAKYGFKQRDFDGGVDTSSSSQSSSDDDDDDYELDENNIPKHIARSNILYSIYGDRLTGGGSEVGKREKSSASSVATLKNILGTVRGANNPHCRRRSESDSGLVTVYILLLPT